MDVGEHVTDAAPILCINSGSSSLKLALFRSDASARILTGGVEGVGLAEGRAWIRGGGGTAEKRGTFAGIGAAIDAVFDLLDARGEAAPGAVGHRVVHGGPRLFDPIAIDDSVLKELHAAVPWAPLHLPPSLDAIAAAQRRAPSVVHVACFDTAFHRALPPVSQRLPLPKSFAERGLRRYGFHGLSYEFIVSTLGDDARGRVIVAHLGSGASLAAVRDGRSVDTTMGLTPMGGVVMGTRTGDLDPGVLLFLMREGWSADALETLVDKESGLRGISGTTADMKALLAARGSDADADLAVTIFCARVRASIGALTTSLGGLDRLVFTGGIGERAAPIRAEIARGLEHLGIALDDARNERSEAVVSSTTSQCDVRVIPTDEEQVIARHTCAVVDRVPGAAR